MNDKTTRPISSSNIHLLPRPKVLGVQAGSFEVDAETLIVLPATAGASGLFAARQLKEEMRQATGPNPAILKLVRPHRTTNVILLICGHEQAEAFGMPIDKPDPTVAHPDQAYRLTVTPESITLYADHPTGLFYAVQTLRQLVRLHGAHLPALSIADWPTLAYRGLMLDISRRKVPTLDTLKELAEKLSFWKLNVLQLYTEHTFQFARHPKIGAGCGSLSSEDILALDEHCRRHHVELMPNLQSFGHFRNALALPEYKHLAETDLLWTLSPAYEESYTLLDEMYGDMLPSFTSTVLNVDCDETWDLGQGASAGLVEKDGVGRVYLNHILRLRELAARYGRRIQVWGDILLHHPELIAEVPEDIVLLDWHYGAADSYPTAEIFGRSGRTFWVCPGVGSWSTLFPRLSNANVNIRNFVRDGVAAGASGMLNTDWGDHGHYQPLGLSWYGYAFGGEQAWNGGTVDDAAFEASFSPLFFGAEHERVLQAMHRLDRTNTLPGVAQRNRSHTVLALFDEPLTGQTIEELPADTVQQMEDLAREALTTFEAVAPGHAEELTLREMASVARLTVYAARKTALAQEIRQGLRELAETRALPVEVGAEQIYNYILTVRQLDRDLEPLRAEFETLWLARARRSEIYVSLGYFANLRARYRAAINWLQEQRQALLAGRPVDADLESYDTGGYRTLWQR